MGLGKSKIVIDEALQLYIDGTIDRVLVVAGKGSYADWLDKHLPENTPSYMRVLAHLWRGKSKQEEENIRTLMYHDPGYGHKILRVLIMNVEAFGLPHSVAETVARNFVNGGKTMIVVDESTKIRNTDAHRTQVMIDLGRRAVVRRAMTGLATPKNPLDLWGQMSFLGLSHVLGSNWYTFRAQYCTMKRLEINVVNPRTKRRDVRRIDKVVGYKNLDRLAALMLPHSFRALKEDCLDLPPKIYERMSVELTPAQKKAYRDMLKLATVELETGVYASATNAMARIGRLHQIVCGFLTDEDGVTHELESNRLSVMEDAIDEMEGSVIVWCAYQHDVVAVANHLRKTYPERGGVVEYYGPTPPHIRAAGVRMFQEGRAAFFVGTAATGGFGITLTAAHNVIYFSSSFDLEMRLQSEDRCHRDGTTHSVTYVDLVSPGTVDTKILKALQEKKSVADVVMDGGVREWLSTIED
jgi:hypothetical protein